MRLLGWAAGGLAALLVLAVAAVLGGLNTDPGRRLAERITRDATGGQVTLAGLAGTFPTALRLGRLELRDRDGVWLTVDDAALDFSPLRLFAGEARASRLAAGRIAIGRLPVPSGPAEAGSGAGGFALPLRVSVARLQIGRLELGAPLAGTATVLTAEGSALLASLWTGEAALTVQRLDAPGRYRLDAAIGAASVHAHLNAEEPAGGVVSQLSGVPQLGAIDAAVTLDGNWRALSVKLAAAAGALRADASGTLDLVDMAGGIDVVASAPAMRPRPDLSWQGVRLEAHGKGRFASPEATATLRLDGVEAAGAGLRALTVQASAHAGAASMQATAEGLRLPGPKPDLLAGAPLRLNVEVSLDAPGRPVRFAVAHQLAGIDGTARTSGALSAEAQVTLPDISPLAAAGGVALQGGAALTVKASQDEAGTHFDVDGTLGVSGGMAPVAALLGPQARLRASAVLRGGDVSLPRLELAGRALTLTAQGGLRGGEAALDWRLGLTDLAVLANRLQGALTAQGHAGGRSGDFSVTADLAGDVGTAGFPRGPAHAVVQVQGLPGHPAGTARADATLEGAPLTLAVQARRAAGGALQVVIDRADWRGTHAHGTLALAPGAVLPLGSVTATVADASDFSRLAGRGLAGSLEAVLRTEAANGVPVAVLDLTARHAGLPGQAMLGEATLAARVRDPAGGRQTEARLAVSGVQAGGIGGALRLDASGPPDALALTFAADLTGVGGADLSAQGTATLNAAARALSVAGLQAGWKGETLRLLAPARLSFADGVAVDRLRLGLGEAVLEVDGRVSPALKLTAALRNVTAGTFRVVAPDLKAEGRLEADATLSGTPARPSGTLHLAATGMRLRQGNAAGLPPAALVATAMLEGDRARLDAALTAGTNRLTLAGTAPLAASGPLDLHGAGTVELATLDPILAAEGRRARGRVALDATVTGSIAAPSAAGTLRLSGGEVQDFALGARLEAIEAVLAAEGQTLRLASFSARTGKGTMSATGTIGLAAPMPVSLTLTAHGASPLAGDRLTALLDAALSLHGEAAGRLQAGGTITLQRADIRIPERLPASLAVLRVHRPGEAPPPPPAPPPDLGLDVTLDAPSRVFVRGRGVDAELSGTLRLGGTLAAPLPEGSFKLRRGQFALAGITLDFTRGEVGFDGSGRLDPTLNFLASSNNGTVIANLAITGYASAPKITLSSTPELPQDEVLAWLLFHQSTANLSPLQLAQIAQALAQISGVGGGFDPLGKLRSGLGLDRLSVGSGEGGKGTAVQAGRYVAQGVYVGAKQGTGGAGSQAVVQVDLYRGVKLQATVGQSQPGATGASTSAQDSGTSVGVTYQFQVPDPGGVYKPNIHPATPEKDLPARRRSMARALRVTRFNSIGGRIALGFAVVLVLLVALGVSDHLGLGSVRAEFDTYESAAGTAERVAQVGATFNMGRRAVLKFLRGGDAAAAAQAIKLLETAQQETTAAAETATDQQLRAALTEAAALVGQHAANFRLLATRVAAREAIVHQLLMPLMAKVRPLLDSLLASSRQGADAVLATQTAQAQESLLLGELSITRFLASADQQEAGEAVAQLDAFAARTEVLRRGNWAPWERGRPQELAGLAARSRAAFVALVPVVEDVERIVDTTNAKLSEQVAALLVRTGNAQAAALRQSQEALQATLDGTTTRGAAMACGAVLLGLLLSVLISRGIARPVARLTASMGALAEGRLDTVVPARDRGDELGTMARTLEVFRDGMREAATLRGRQAAQAQEAEAVRRAALRELAGGFEAKIGQLVARVAEAAGGLRTTASALEGTARQTDGQSATVASAAEEASANVRTVAVAAEELSASTVEIGRQVAQSASVAGRAVADARRTDQVVRALAEGARQIGEVVGLISSIAGQTNLLALNATIEAARAGESGRGFAVVAGEVKGLAAQTARATGDIARQIAQIQGATNEAVAAIGGIAATIEEVSHIAAAIAAAVEEQGAATREIARNVQEAAQGARMVSETIVGVSTGAQETGRAAGVVLQGAAALSGEAEGLRGEVSRFLAEVRAG